MPVEREGLCAQYGFLKNEDVPRGVPVLGVQTAFNNQLKNSANSEEMPTFICFLVGVWLYGLLDKRKGHGLGPGVHLFIL